MNTIHHFYDERQVGTIFYPDMARIAAAAEMASMPPAAADQKKVCLLLIDMQVDFCHAQGSLNVPGSEDDIRRVCQFIGRYAEKITDIICTLDSHLPYQIFHAAWWLDADGRPPDPFTLIDASDVREGRWRARVMPQQSLQYVEALENEAKKKLTIWPYHVLIGGVGNSLDPSLWSVVMWHALARKSQPTWLEKGRVPHSEHYSAIQPEIDIPVHPQGKKHIGLLNTLRGADAIFMAGEAQSHCVLETLEDIVTEFGDNSQRLGRIYVLQDCMSPVVHPEIDFGAIAERRFADFAALGVNFVSSTDSLPILEAATHDAPEETDDDTVAGLQRMGQWERTNSRSRHGDRDDHSQREDE